MITFHDYTKEGGFPYIMLGEDEMWLKRNTWLKTLTVFWRKAYLLSQYIICALLNHQFYYPIVILAGENAELTNDKQRVKGVQYIQCRRCCGVEAIDIPDESSISLANEIAHNWDKKIQVFPDEQV